MTTKPLVSPRKRATQARSRATVDALIEATARILVREGFDNASTNRIADAAGVSVGSLYQYYPNKAALLVAVIERHNSALMGIVLGALADVAAEPLETGLRKLIRAAVAGHRADPDLHRVLAEEIPRVGALEDAEAFNRAYYDLFKSYLATHRDELRPLDLELATFVCVTSIEALTHTAVLHRAEFLMDAAAERLVDESTRMILGYLT